MKKKIFAVVSYSRVIGTQDWQKDSVLFACTNKEDALRDCARMNEKSEGIFLEFKYEVQELDLFYSDYQELDLFDYYY